MGSNSFNLVELCLARCFVCFSSRICLGICSFNTEAKKLYYTVGGAIRADRHVRCDNCSFNCRNEACFGEASGCFEVIWAALRVLDTVDSLTISCADAIAKSRLRLEAPMQRRSQVTTSRLDQCVVNGDCFLILLHAPAVENRETLPAG